MKYMMKSFSVGGSSPDYRKNWEQIFGKPAKPATPKKKQQTPKQVASPK